jgi:hypothetical protein
MEADELAYHRLSHSHNDIGIWAALYAAPRPVTAHRHDFYEIAFALSGSGQHEDEGGQDDKPLSQDRGRRIGLFSRRLLLVKR